MSALPDFYQVTIFKACAEPDTDGDCVDIPAGEIGSGLNYPVQIDNDNCDASCEDDDPALIITKEKPRGGAGYAFASGSFNLQFLEDGSIITDRAGQCQATGIRGATGPCSGGGRYYRGIPGRLCVQNSAGQQ
jgi:hypothetical protein